MQGAAWPPRLLVRLSSCNAYGWRVLRAHASGRGAWCVRPHGPPFDPSIHGDRRAHGFASRFSYLFFFLRSPPFPSAVGISQWPRPRGWCWPPGRAHASLARPPYASSPPRAPRGAFSAVLASYSLPASRALSRRVMRHAPPPPRPLCASIAAHIPIIPSALFRCTTRFTFRSLRCENPPG